MTTQPITNKNGFLVRPSYKNIAVRSDDHWRLTGSIDHRHRTDHSVKIPTMDIEPANFARIQPAVPPRIHMLKFEIVAEKWTEFVIRTDEPQNPDARVRLLDSKKTWLKVKAGDHVMTSLG